MTIPASSGECANRGRASAAPAEPAGRAARASCGVMAEGVMLVALAWGDSLITQWPTTAAAPLVASPQRATSHSGGTSARRESRRVDREAYRQGAAGERAEWKVRQRASTKRLMGRKPTTFCMAISR